MTNRLTSLFELDELLGITTREHIAARSQKRRRTNGSATLAPSCPPKSSSAPKSSKATPSTGRWTVTAQSFDNGAPIRCEHDVAYRPVASIEVESTRPRREAPATQLSVDDYDVEAFEESDEGSQLQLNSDEDADNRSPLDAPPLRADAPLAFSKGTVSRSASSALTSQLSAVERDLADLAAHSSTPAEIPPTPLEARRDEGYESDAAPSPPVRASGHGVFDTMAQGMGYATEFRLPPVQLSQVFSALDQQLDAHEAGDASQRAITAARALSDVGVYPPSETPVVGSETLIRDLVAMRPAQRANESPLPTPANTTVNDE